MYVYIGGGEMNNLVCFSHIFYEPSDLCCSYQRQEATFVTHTNSTQFYQIRNLHIAWPGTCMHLLVILLQGKRMVIWNCLKRKKHVFYVHLLLFQHLKKAESLLYKNRLNLHFSSNDLKS